MHNTRIVSLLLAVASLWTTPAWSKTYPLPPADSRLIGALEDYIVQPGDHLELVGKHTRTGFLALLEANPGVDPYLPTPGTRLSQSATTWLDSAGTMIRTSTPRSTASTRAKIRSSSGIR